MKLLQKKTGQYSVLWYFPLLAQDICGECSIFKETINYCFGKNILEVQQYDIEKLKSQFKTIMRKILVNGFPRIVNIN